MTMINKRWTTTDPMPALAGHDVCDVVPGSREKRLDCPPASFRELHSFSEQGSRSDSIPSPTRLHRAARRAHLVRNY